MCTFFLKSLDAIVAPIIAAAILSKNDERKKIIANNANAPCHHLGKIEESISVTLLFSK